MSQPFSVNATHAHENSRRNNKDIFEKLNPKEIDAHMLILLLLYFFFWFGTVINTLVDSI